MIPLPPCDHDGCSKTECAQPGSVQPDGSVTALDGYIAAGMQIERVLAEAERKRPKRSPDYRLAAYRAGFYDAIVMAHCFMVYGEFAKRNEEQIRKILQSPNDKLTP